MLVQRMACIRQYSIRRMTRGVIADSFGEAVRCRQYSSRYFQGDTTKYAGTAKPRLHRERSWTLMKVTGSKSEDTEINHLGILYYPVRNISILIIIWEI